MKKILGLFAIMISCIASVNAQVSGKAVGLRLIYAEELSYQQALSNTNRLEINLGLRSFGENAIGTVSRGAAINGVYQWVWDLSDLAEGFNWYAGAGGSLLAHDSKFGFGALGQVGIEYKFPQVPLQLSLDYCPGLYIIPETSKISRLSFAGPCLSARFCF